MSRSSGFTLLEILVALVVLGFVFVMMDQGLAFGLRAVTIQAATKDRHGDLDAVDRALRRLIARADPGHYPEPAPFRGGPDALALVSELPVASDGRTQRVEARLSAEAGQLRLRWSRLRHAESFGPPPLAQQTVVVDGVQRLELSYFGKSSRSWSPSWSADALPTLVRLQIMFADRHRYWPPIIVATTREPLQE